MILIRVLCWVAAGALSIIGAEFYHHVHSERWSVKTLADHIVLSDSVVSTTISEQQALSAPTVGEGSPRGRSEHTLYKLVAELVEVQTQVDGDYHLVLREPKTGLQMVAEIPEPTEPVPLRYWKSFGECRQTIDKLVGEPGSTIIRPAQPPLVEITGIGFFDVPHIFIPQGMAPNFREIHPVLHIDPLTPQIKGQQ